MTCPEVIIRLQSMANETYKANVKKMGIPAQCSIGVSTANIRSFAKVIGKSNTLAHELWESGYHEARLLAVLLFDKKAMSLDKAEQLMSDVISWDLCDHLCKNLILKMKNYEALIPRWILSDQTYQKRAAFTLIASSVVHNRKITNDTLDRYLQLIVENSRDEREHVKKAASWALREIGKKDFNYNEKTLLLAYELKENGNKAQIWIAKYAIKELETLVQVNGRKRLISYNAKMGKSEC